MITMDKIFIILLVFVNPLARAATNDKCPTSNKADVIETWRSEMIKDVTDGEFSTVVDLLNDCFPRKIPQCLVDIKLYVASKNDSRGITDYEDGRLTLKSERDLPREFLAKDENNNTIKGSVQIPSNILEIAKEKGWKVSSYKTRSSGGFDLAPNLFIVVIPGEKRDIVIQTSPFRDENHMETANDPVPRPSTGSLTKGQTTMTVISVDKSTDPPVGQLRLLMGSQGRYEWNNTQKVVGCIGCHASPLRPLSPLGYKVRNGNEKSMTPAHAREIDEINMILAQPNISWGRNTIDGIEVKLGPPMDSHPLGWAPPNSFTRSQEFIKECSSKALQHAGEFYRGFANYRIDFSKPDPSQINWQRVASAMNCTQCHDNNNARGVLHNHYEKNEVIFKVAVDRSMPMNLNLNGDERLALIACLYEEKKVLEKEWTRSGEWLSKTSCYGNKFEKVKTPVKSRIKTPVNVRPTPARGIQ